MNTAGWEAWISGQVVAHAVRRRTHRKVAALLAARRVLDIADITQCAADAVAEVLWICHLSDEPVQALVEAEDLEDALEVTRGQG